MISYELLRIPLGIPVAAGLRTGRSQVQLPWAKLEYHIQTAALAGCTAIGIPKNYYNIE